ESPCSAPVAPARHRPSRGLPRASARARASTSGASSADRSSSGAGYTARTAEPSHFLIWRSRTMTFASVQELIAGVRPVIDLNGGVRVKDPAALRGQVIDELVHTAVFGQGDARDAARWVIWEAGHELGIQSASIDALYQARARNEYEGM